MKKSISFPFTYLRLFLLSILSFFLLISCSPPEDDDSQESITANLQGAYNIVGFSGNYSETEIINGMPVVYTSEVTASDFINATMSFNEDFTITSTGSYTLTETTNEDGVMDVNIFNEQVEFNGSYSVNNTSINVTLGETGNVLVQNLTQDSLELLIRINQIDGEERYQAQALIELIKQ